MLVHVVTLFPEFFRSPLEVGRLRKAIGIGALEVRFVNPRDFAEDRYGTVDDTPYGGGAGMVMKPEPIFRAVESIVGEGEARRGVPVILLTPQGRPYGQARARSLAEEPEVVLVTGHYKGVDERVALGLATEELSVGDFVLSDGDVPALAVLDSVARLLPGVLGNEESAETDSFEDGILDASHYTRPAEYRGMRVPEVLISGHHARIEDHRREDALRRTRERRPDLLAGREGGPAKGPKRKKP
jgi:tRNA (guanine37-N1)-methyltransferase